jgi:hypothetical protein
MIQDGVVTTTGAPSDARLFLRSPSVEEAPLQGELMLFDPATSRFFVLNSTMSFVWRRCDGEHTLSGMLREMTEAFTGVEAPAAERDIRGALSELESLGLLAPAPMTTAGSI